MYQSLKFLDKIVTRIVEYVTASWQRLNCDFSHPVWPRTKRPRFTIVKSESPTLKKYMNVKIEVKTLCLQNERNYNHKFCPFKQVMSKAYTYNVQHLRLSKWFHRRFRICGMWHCVNVGLFPTFWRIIVPSCLRSCSQSCLCRPHTSHNSRMFICLNIWECLWQCLCKKELNFGARQVIFAPTQQFW